MATARPFAYNTGSSIDGTEQIGNLAIGTPTNGFDSTGLKWWNGPDEDLGYVIAHQTPSGQPGADGDTAYLGFFRSASKTDLSFINLSNSISGQNFLSAGDAVNWLNANGYWTSYPASKNILFLGDTGVNTMASNISQYITNTGYSITYSAVTMGTTYTGGSDITPDNYDVVVMYTNGAQTGGAGLSTNLVNYINAGGNVVTGVFLWNVYSAGFAVSTISAFNATNTQGNPPGGNIVITSATTITDGIGLTMPTFFYNNNPTLVSGAVQLATYSNGANLLATKSVGSSKLVSINAAPLNITNSTSTICKMFGNSILYAAGVI